MKKIFTVAIAMLIMATSFGQTDSTKKTKTTAYASLGISIGNVNVNDAGTNKFSKASFPSVEIGVMRKNISIGAAFGYENLLATSETRGFYELKTSAYHVIVGDCSGYILFGVGAYFEKSFHSFIEYGFGFSYAPKKLGYFVQYSNWANANYVSVGLSYNF
jgi:hypothetical protein